MTIRRRALFLALCFVAAGCPNLFAQNTQVEGIVRDTSGTPVNGAKVSLLAGTLKSSAETDSGGKFSFSDVHAIEGSIEVSAN